MKRLNSKIWLAWKIHVNNFLCFDFVSCLPFHFDDLASVLEESEHKFNILEYQSQVLYWDSSTIQTIDVQRYNIEHTPTKSPCGYTLLYKNNSFNYKVRKNLIIHKEKHLKSTLIEILNKNSKNIIARCTSTI